MLALVDRLTKDPQSQAHYRELAAADWRSAAEFQGYLLALLEGRLDLEEGLKGGTSPWERDWLRTVGGILRLEQGRPEEAKKLLEPVVLAGDAENWAFFLARARLEELRRRGFSGFGEPFEQRVREALAARRERQAELAPLLTQLASGDLATEERRAILKQVAGLDPENTALSGILAFLGAALGDFPGALERIKAYSASGGRATALPSPSIWAAAAPRSRFGSFSATAPRSPWSPLRRPGSGPKAERTGKTPCASTAMRSAPSSTTGSSTTSCASGSKT
jgi:hypothetical protein